MKKIKFINDRADKLLSNLIASGSEISLWDSDLYERLWAIVKSPSRTLIRGPKPSSIFSKEKQCKDYDKMPVTWLPNCMSYQSKKQPLSFIDLMFKNFVRQEKEGAKIIGFTNHECNRFLKYRFNHLGHLRDQGEYKEYWRVAENLLQNPLFIVLCFNRVFPNWHKDMPISQVTKILKEVKKMVATRPVKINFRRVYIPKANGKWRPLGVPSLSWRVYLHMWNCLIVWFRVGKEGDQHAYFPGRGINTAWLDLLERLGTSPNVYEYDLSSFFDSVDLKYLEEKMGEIGITESTRKYLSQLNQSVVKLATEDKQIEQDRKVLFNSDGTPNPNLSESEQKSLLEYTKGEVTFPLKEYLAKGFTLVKKVGVPQGASTSCGLSTLNLLDLLRKFHRKVVQYADDGIVFPENSESAPDVNVEDAGVSMNASKSKWVKKGGKWIESLKFLGLRYIPSDVPDPLDGSIKNHTRLRAETRNGSTLELGMPEQFQSYVNAAIARILNHLKSWVEEETGGNWSYLPRLKERFHLELQDMGLQATVGEYIIAKLVEFDKLPEVERLKTIFAEKAGARQISGVFNNDRNLVNVADTRLTFIRQSWDYRNLGNYLYNLRIESIRELLKYKKEGIAWDLEVVYDDETGEGVKELETQIETYTAQIQFLDEVLTPSEEWIKELARDSLFQFDNKGSEEYKLRKAKLDPENKAKFLEYRRRWKEIYSELKVNIHNVSTYACSDLLFHMVNGLERIGKRKAVKRLRCAGLRFLEPSQAKEEFETSKSKKKKNKMKKLRQEARKLTGIQQ